MSKFIAIALTKEKTVHRFGLLSYKKYYDAMNRFDENLALKKCQRILKA